MNNNNRVTIVCCYNNKAQYEKELLASVNMQNEKCDLLAIDNCTNRFNSCSKALNSVLSQIKTEYVIFSHQDIILSEDWFLSKFTDYMTEGNIGDIYGVAGTSLNDLGILTTIYEGREKNKIGNKVLKNIQKCDTVDECFFGGKTKTFQNSPFNEEICDNWHLYAVEKCLNARIHGHSVYVCEIPLIHSSKGNCNHDFYRNFRTLCKFYSKYYSEIYTTCCHSKTDIFSRNFHYLKIETKSLIKRFLHYE